MYIQRALFLVWVTLVSSVKPRLRGNSRTYQPKLLGTKETLSPALDLPQALPTKALTEPLTETPTKALTEPPTKAPTKSSSRIPTYLIATSVSPVYMLPSSPVSLRHTQLLLPTPYPTSRPPPVTEPAAPATEPVTPAAPFATNTTEIIPECLFMTIPPAMVMPPCGKYQFINHDTREEL
jgi:hypothetical protein